MREGIRQHTIDQLSSRTELPEAARIQILAPGGTCPKVEYAKVFEDARNPAVRVRVDGSLYDLSETIRLDKNKKHTIEIVVDRLVVRPDIRHRLADSLEIASTLTGGLVVVDVTDQGRELLFSQNYACEDCGISIENSPRACSPSTTLTAPVPRAPAWEPSCA
jgi:excinuclease ABC subunit A